MAEYVLGIVPRGNFLAFLFLTNNYQYIRLSKRIGTHDWNKFFSPEEINSMFEKSMYNHN